MDKILKKINYLVITIIIVLILFFYFWVFTPLKTELEISLKENFQNTVDITEMNVENKFHRYIEGAESLSSRTMIRNKIEAYQLGEVSFLELQDYTHDKYRDGVKVLDNIVAAFRVTDDKMVVKWGNRSLEDFSEHIKYDTKETVIKVIESKSLILINSLIVKDGTKLGYDIVIYDLKPLIRQIDQEHLISEIIFDSKTPDNYETEEKIVAYRKLLETNYWLKSEKSKDDLYYSLNKLSSRIIIGFLILIGLIIIVFYKISKETSTKVINQLEAKVEKITEISETDDMLGIYNRSKFFKTLNSEIYRCRRYNHNLSVIMIDVDHFKEINDNYGHLVGDKILLKLSKIIENEIRIIDLFARYGGDEFMILSPETNLEEAVNLAKRLKNVLEKENFLKVGKVSCSFGVTTLEEADDIDSLIFRVDNALYKAKEKRNAIASL